MSKNQTTTAFAGATPTPERDLCLKALRFHLDVAEENLQTLRGMLEEEKLAEGPYAEHALTFAEGVLAPLTEFRKLVKGLVQASRRSQRADAMQRAAFWTASLLGKGVGDVAR